MWRLSPSLLLSVGYAHMLTDFLSRSRVQKRQRERRRTLQWRSWPHLLSRWSRLTSSVRHHADSMCTWYNVVRMVLHPCGLPQKTCNPSLIMRKTSHSSKWKDSVQNTWWVLKTVQFLQKQGKSEKLSHRKLRGMAAECNVHPETEKDMRGKK